MSDALVVPADMTQEADIARLVSTTLDHFGRIDVLINNAGRGMYVPLEHIDLAEYARLVELNVYGPLRAMQAVIPIMRRQGGGAIVNVSSMLTTMHIPNLAGYASTKYALNDLTLTARAELASDHIVVSLVRPKLTDTDFGRNAVKAEPNDIRRDPGRLMDTPEVVADMIVRVIISGDAEANL